MVSEYGRKQMKLQYFKFKFSINGLKWSVALLLLICRRVEWRYGYSRYWCQPAIKNLTSQFSDRSEKTYTDPCSIRYDRKIVSHNEDYFDYSNWSRLQDQKFENSAFAKTNNRSEETNKFRFLFSMFDFLTGFTNADIKKDFSILLTGLKLT